VSTAVIARLDRAIQYSVTFVILRSTVEYWIPAFAGMTTQNVAMAPTRLARTLIAVFAALCFCTTAHAQAPIKDGDILTGTLRVVRTRHDNGTRIVAYQIVSKPRAMPAGDDFCTAENGATTFHLFAITDGARKQLKARLGKSISVKAVKLFCAQTAWHIGDVAVPEWTLQ
jgi:hypothetical protein